MDLAWNDLLIMIQLILVTAKSFGFARDEKYYLKWRHIFIPTYILAIWDLISIFFGGE